MLLPLLFRQYFFISLTKQDNIEVNIRMKLSFLVSQILNTFIKFQVLVLLLFWWILENNFY